MKHPAFSFVLLILNVCAQKVKRTSSPLYNCIAKFLEDISYTVVDVAVGCVDILDLVARCIQDGFLGPAHFGHNLLVC